jgi:pyridoxal phosphate enzyme (YggS family)
MPGHVSDIQTNLLAVRERIRHAASSAARSPDAVRLIAVSKYVDQADIVCAIRAGQHIFGESTVQEGMSRRALMRDRATEWHFIGHLQSNKARHIPGNFAWLHTLDSVKLARRLSRHAEASAMVVNTLLQVNIAADPGKFGIPPGSVFGLVDELLRAGLNGIRLRGLMTIGRLGASGADTRRDFSRLRDLRDACAIRFGREMFSELSMGMSGDFEMAITEGSTMVRVGSAIFGARPQHHN